ncbi:MAG: PhoH family protein, partial [Phycisphaeraceae bacterium]
MELTIRLPHGEERIGVTGTAERNLKIIREALGVNITARNGALRLSGDSEAVGQAAHVLERLGEAAREHKPMGREELLNIITTAGAERRDRPAAAGGAAAAEGPRKPMGEGLDVYLSGRRVRPMTDGQQAYLRAILHYDLTFCVGPAGTGKTYLAVAQAVSQLMTGSVQRLILSRPAVEAGEKIGFLPGDMREKVDPYMQP